MTIDAENFVTSQWRKDMESVLWRIRMIERIARKRKWQKSRYEKNRGYLCSLTR